VSAWVHRSIPRRPVVGSRFSVVVDVRREYSGVVVLLQLGRQRRVALSLGLSRNDDGTA